MSVLLLSLLLSSCWKSDAQKYAENICHPTRGFVGNDKDRFSSCIPREFGRGKKLSDLRRYLKGANFYQWNKIKSGDNTLEEYISINENEKYVAKSNIIFKYGRDKKIIEIEANQWRGLNGPDIHTRN